DAVCPAAGATENDIGLDPAPRECRAKQPERQTVVLAEWPEGIERQYPDVSIGEFGKGQVGLVQGCVQGGLREGLEHGEDHALGPSPLGQVVMDDRDGGHRAFWASIDRYTPATCAATISGANSAAFVRAALPSLSRRAGLPASS